MITEKRLHVGPKARFMVTRTTTETRHTVTVQDADSGRTLRRWYGHSPMAIGYSVDRFLTERLGIWRG